MECFFFFSISLSLFCFCLLTERINYKLFLFFTLFYTKMLLYSLSLCLYTKNLICHLRTQYACAIIAYLLSIIANALFSLDRLQLNTMLMSGMYVWYECVW